MTSRRIRTPSLVMFTVVAGAVASWVVLGPEPAPASDIAAAQGSPVSTATEPEPHPAIASTRATMIDTGEPSTLTEPLARQRARLQATEASLRDRARHAPEATRRALDDHLARVQQRLTALDRSRG